MVNSKNTLVHFHSVIVCGQCDVISSKQNELLPTNFGMDINANSYNDFVLLIYYLFITEEKANIFKFIGCLLFKQITKL